MEQGKEKGKSFIIQRGGDNKVYKSREEIRDFVQTIIGNSVNLSTLIGSGASLPAIPLMGSTFKEYRKNIKKEKPDLSKILEDRLNKICQKHTSYELDKFKNIEFLLSWLQYRIDGDADTCNEDQQLFIDLKNTFINSVSNAKGNEESSNKVRENYLHVIQGLGKSRQILARQQKTVFDIVNLFTTNYDLFHEGALEKSRYTYTDGFSNGIHNKFSNREFHRRPIDLEDRFKDKLQPVNPFFRLLKLHGSINWIKRENEVMRTTNIPCPAKESTDEVLISPTSSKFALTQNEPYSDLFREFVNIMAVPNSALFTSAFSFNDSHIANLVESALDRTDFTLYAFIENPEFAEKNSNFTNFIQSISNSPNAFLIYPNCETDYEKKKASADWMNPPLKFEDFAYFMQPDVISEDEGIIDKNNSKEDKNE